MDIIRNQLKTMNHQFSFYMKQKTSYKNNLISLLDQTYPGINDFFDSPARSDGSQKWVDFVSSFWHVDCVRSLGLATFTERYQKWCKRHGYNFQPEKPAQIYSFSKELISVFTKDSVTKFLVKQALSLIHISEPTRRS